MKSSELKKMISGIVAEELRRQLPAMIEKVLTESYLRKIVSEQSAPAQRRSVPSLRETMQEQETDEVPRPLPNTDQGAYQENDVIKRKNEIISKLMGGDMGFIYEDVKPLPTSPSVNKKVSLGESQMKFGEEGVPLEMLGFDPKVARNLIGETKNQSRPAARDVQKFEEERLARLRAQLDVPVK